MAPGVYHTWEQPVSYYLDDLELNGIIDLIDHFALVRHGADQFKVELELNGEKVIHRPELKDCSPKPDAIAKKLNVSKEVLATLFDTRHFFSLHPDEKKRVIFDLLDLKVTRTNIKRKLKSWLKEHPGLIEKYPVRVSNTASQVDPDDDLLSVLGSVPGSLEEAYTQAFDERRLVKSGTRPKGGESERREDKRELKALGPIVDLPDGITEDEIMEENRQLLQAAQREEENHAEYGCLDWTFRC